MNAFSSTARTAFHYAFPRISFKLMHMRRVHDEVEMDLLPILVDEHKEAVDVGANVGRYAKPLSALATHVHAFEPHPRLARVLSRSLPRNVTVNQTAVSSTFGRVVLHIPIVHGRQDEGIAHISSPSEDERCDKIEVACVPLDTLASRNIGFLKIDVEGHEHNVLCGAELLLKSSRPIALVEVGERHNKGAVAATAARFARLGYTGAFVYERKIEDIADFRPQMQDIALLEGARDGTSRRDIPYVNNFIFVPQERVTPNFRARAEAILAE